MPPTDQPKILRPGAKLVEKDADGNITSFGGIRVRDVKEAATRGVCLGIYGPAGAGKTTLCCTAVRNLELGAPGIVLDAEGGARSVADEMGLEWGELITFDDAENFVQAALAVGENNFKWRSVILDNLSELAEMCRREVTKGDTTTQPEYNQVTTRVKNLVRDYRNLSRLFGVNVFIVMWDTPEKNEAGATIARRVNFTPKLASQLPGVVDLIGYLEVIDNPPHFSRNLHLEATPRLDSKWRVAPSEVANTMPRQIVNPTMDEILDTLIGGKPFPAHLPSHKLPGAK